MRKVIFNIFLVVETIFNLKLLMVAYLVVSLFAVVCSYDASVANNYGGYLLSANTSLSAGITWFVVISLSATSLKMLINETKTGLGIGFLKAIIPFICGVLLLLASGRIVEFLVTKFNASSEYQVAVFGDLVVFWVLLLIVVVKGLVNSNAGFVEVSQLTGSNEVALKYFDGVLSDVNFEICDMLALKYEGDESNE